VSRVSKKFLLNNPIDGIFKGHSPLLQPLVGVFRYTDDLLAGHRKISLRETKADQIGYPPLKGLDKGGM